MSKEEFDTIQRAVKHCNELYPSAIIEIRDCLQDKLIVKALYLTGVNRGWGKKIKLIEFEKNDAKLWELYSISTWQYSDYQRGIVMRTRIDCKCMQLEAA